MTDLIERLRWYPKEIGENRLMHEAADELERLDASRDRWIAQLKVLIAEKQRLEATLQRIENWCKAYPHTVFIEPTKEQWRTADETLDAHKGDNCPSLTAISGSNMRHVVEGIQKIITEALDKEQT